MKNVQIPQELFMKLLRYHLLDDDSCTEEVKNGLEQKMNAMVERELYTRTGAWHAPVSLADKEKQQM